MNTNHNNTIYTIGYTSISNVEVLGKLATKYNANIIDVRLVPFTSAEYLKQYNATNIMMNIPSDIYHHFSSFGNVNYKQKNGEFKLENEGMAIRILRSYLKKSNVILLCACKDYHKCHRTYIARLMQTHYGIKVIHIMKHNNKGKGSE